MNHCSSNLNAAENSKDLMNSGYGNSMFFDESGLVQMDIVEGH